MEINVLDKDYKLVAVVDDYISLIWCKRYYDIGALDLEIEENEKNVEVFKEGNYITRKDDDVIYKIEAIELNTRTSNNSLIVGAVDCKKILSQRIVANTISFSGTVQDYIFRMINENVINPEISERKINNFNLVEELEINDVIEQQVTYEILSEKIIDLCKMFHLGWKVFCKNGVFYFKLFKGVDKSKFVVFSLKNNNLISSKYTQDKTKFKNIALVAGDGEGENRKRIWVGNAKGLERFEMFVDDSSSSDGLEQMEYLQQLKYKGSEKLAKNAVLISFEGEVDFNYYKYKTDYDLGDIVTIQNEFGISTKARITEVVETWDDDGYSLEPKLEYDEFKIVEPPKELEKKQISYIENVEVGSEFTFNAADYPNGISFAIGGSKGQNGQNGTLYVKPVDRLFFEFTSVPSDYAGNGGTGGKSKLYELTIDGLKYNVFAQGGAGGGGGGAGVDYFTNWGEQNVIEGLGGTGANGDILNIDIESFTNSVTIKCLSTIDEPNGEKGDSGVYCDNTTYTFFNGGDSGDGNTGEVGQKYKSGNGAAASIPKGSYCEYPNYYVDNSNSLSLDILGIYTWEKI